ncbi:hypothetical protein LENED_003956 [Lentinula edodes]|uniref:Uncharacterized protein n=1 Tax=Lentinula edodes TaxID=5353 RepID=A0A1Q3E5L8_LENED|nr:hypothetical protein LENED_003956 [Lentinula edodes]
MASLLDEDGAISESFENCLKHIFTKYCNPKSTQSNVSCKSINCKRRMTRRKLGEISRNMAMIIFLEGTYNYHFRHRIAVIARAAKEVPKQK